MLLSLFLAYYRILHYSHHMQPLLVMLSGSKDDKDNPPVDPSGLWKALWDDSSSRFYYWNTQVGRIVGRIMVACWLGLCMLSLPHLSTRHKTGLQWCWREEARHVDRDALFPSLARGLMKSVRCGNPGGLHTRNGFQFTIKSLSFAYV